MTPDAQRLARINRRKRWFDLLVVACLAPVLAPVGAATGFAVRLSMGRPVLFTQPRAGLHEQEFRINKFRTMTEDTGPDGHLLQDHQRLTRTGAILRKLSLDELPQFINVLRGDMSLVGPRPLYVHYLSHYTPREKRRHMVRPGITGLAQVSGRNSVAWEQRLALDVEYVDKVGLRTDLRLLVKTLLRVARGSGVSLIANDSGEPLNIVRSYPAKSGVSMRRFEYRDIPERVRLFNDPNIRRHMQLPNAVTKQGTTTWFHQARADSGYYDFVIYEQVTLRTIGLAGLRAGSNVAMPEMYLLIDPAYQGRGLGRVALDLLLTWMRNNTEFHGCCLTVDRRNLPAVKLYQSQNFKIAATSNDGERLEMTVLWN